MFEVKTDKAVLLVYDMVGEMVANEPWVSEAMAVLVDLVRRCRRASVPVVYAVGATSARAGSAICSDIAPEPSEQTFIHPESGVFIGTDFDQFLTTQKRDVLLIAGMAVDRGCNTSARDALNRGFRPVMVQDLCFTRDIADSPVGPVAKHDVARVHLAALHRMGVGLMTAAELAASLN